MQKEITNIIKEIFKFLDISPDIEVTKQAPEASDPEKGRDPIEAYDVKIEGGDLSYLIGTRGASLDALQTISGLMLFRRTGNWAAVNVDINGYKDKKALRIEEMVKKYIDKVRFFQKDVELPAMNPWERRLVHMFVREYSDIHSESAGEGISRHVVLSNK